MSITVPFAQYVGLQLREQDRGRAVVVLPESKETSNHVGTQHAGALFTLAETASGSAVLGLFSDRIASGTVLPVVRSASIQYLKPGRGVMTATAMVKANADEVLHVLQTAGRADFEAEVSVRDHEDVLVATCIVQWHFRQVSMRAKA